MAASDTTIATAIGSGLLGLALITTIAMITAYYTMKRRVEAAASRHQKIVLPPAQPLLRTSFDPDPIPPLVPAGSETAETAVDAVRSARPSTQVAAAEPADDEDDQPPPAVAPRRNWLMQSNWMNLDQLRELIDDLVRVEDDFLSVPVNDCKSLDPATCPEDKNRYSNILPNPHSRVILSKVDDDPTSTYINANWMQGFNHEKEYILTQGPLGTTILDFWRMVWESESRVVVMIARLMEDGRPKCVQYWADRDEKYKIANFILAWDDTEAYPFFKVTTMRLGNAETKETRVIKHFWFDSWPDHGVPNSTDACVDLVHATRQAREEANREAGKFLPMVVHCSAGVGRTGVFVASDIALQQAEMYRKVDPLGILCHMRRARGGCVQTAPQYLYFLLIVRNYLSLMQLYNQEKR